jgi:hypothetical protein
VCLTLARAPAALSPVLGSICRLPRARPDRQPSYAAAEPAGRRHRVPRSLFERYGIQLWAPEVGGRIDYHAEDHEQTMLALGLQSKREITRTWIRTAMAAQTREQGRYLGGRPPYGYRLGDAGAHPNKAHAAWGRRAHRLDPTRLPRRWSGGCSRGGWPGTAPRGSAVP